MYKKISIIFTCIFIIFLVFSIPVFADPPGGSTLKGIFENPQSGNGTFYNAGNKVLGLVFTVASIASVGILMVVGIRYMISSPEDKASIKSRAIPYVVGAIIVFAAVNIANLFVTMAGWING